MEKKSKKGILVGITSLVLVMLLLLGLTYAYYRTRVFGNTSEKPSISVQSKKLEIVYEDMTANITATDAEPGKSYTKSFTVTNNGDEAIKYSVILDKVYNEFTRTSDWTYTVTCSSTIGECSGVTNKEYPMGGGNKGAGTGDGIVVLNTIEPTAIQTYKFTLIYQDLTNVNQSEDMGKVLEGRLNIVDYETLNPYSDNTDSLAYQLINNALNVSDADNLSGYAKYATTPLSELANGKSGAYYEEASFETTTQTFGVTDKTLYWTYGTKYSFNKNSGYTITDAKTGTYDEMVAALANGNVYLTDTSESGNTSTADLIRGYSNMEELYKVTAATDTSVTIVKKSVVEKMFNESTISVIEEGSGTTQYYRGNVTNNYVNFAGMCWRVVRITNDGGIKLILEDYDNECASSDGNYYIPSGYTSQSSATHLKDGVIFGWSEAASLFNTKTWRWIDYLNTDDHNTKYKNLINTYENFQTTKLASYINKLKVGNWCVDETAYTDKVGEEFVEPSVLANVKNGSTIATASDYSNLYPNIFYTSYTRLRGQVNRSVNLECKGTSYTQFVDGTDMYVGTLTADEMVLAGAKSGVSNSNYYLVNGQAGWWWGLSPWSWTKGAYSDYVITVASDGEMNSYMITNHGYARPSIILDDTKISVSLSSTSEVAGTKTNPYVIG